MNYPLSRRARALASVSMFAFSVTLLAACNSEGEIAVAPAPVDPKGEQTQMASGDHAQMGAHGQAPAPQVKMPLFHDLGSHTHKITTKDRETQLYFVGSSRVDLQACKLEYSIVSPK